VEHISIKAMSPDEKNDNSSPRNALTWDENCDWTKLRVFELEGYDTILYIDPDCLVLKDVGHLLHIIDPNILPKENEKRVGLLAAAPDVIHPDKFNAGVMLLRPSSSVFNEMMSQLVRVPTFKHDSCNPNRELPISASKPNDSTFLNYFYPGWYSDMPSFSRLSFGYNAQPLMYKQPKYKDEEIDDISIIHFSSTPKPWEKNAVTSSCETNEEFESMWRTAYEKSQRYHADKLKKRRVGHIRQGQHAKPVSQLPTPPDRSKPKNVNSLVHRRYNELRKTGIEIKEAMSIARAEYGLDKIVDINPARAVGQMFGLN
jgi:lipopolysaccharide biosynthesis glycosyltransferase